MPTTEIVRTARDEYGRACDGGEPDIMTRLLRAYWQSCERSRADTDAPNNHARHTLHNEPALTRSASLS